MDPEQLAGKSVTQLLALQRRGEVCAVAIVEAHISRIEAVNPKLNAVVCTRYDLARSQARDVDQRRARYPLIVTAVVATWVWAAATRCCTTFWAIRPA